MATPRQLITSSLWFDRAAEEAARFYVSVFPESSMGEITHYGSEGQEIHGMPEGLVMTVTFYLSGMEFTALNGGPLFRFNPSVSYYVVCETQAETEHIWNALIEGGSALMPLDRYAWSEQYGWLQDRYGVSWQITLGNVEETGQKITPLLMFCGEQQGKAAEAIDFYTLVFDGSVRRMVQYEAGEAAEDQVKHAQFSLAGQQFMAMDSGVPQPFTFNEAISLVIHCGSQEEIDHYWNKLTDGGEESQCGWLKDRFGVWWQVSPIRLREMLDSSSPEKAARITRAFLKMKKFELEELERIYNE